AVQGNYLFTTCEKDSLRVYDISEPTLPSEDGSHKIYFGQGIAVEDEFAYVTDRYFFRVFDCSEVIDLPQPPVRMNIPIGANRYELVSSPLQLVDLRVENIFGAIEGLEIVYQNDGHVYIPEGFNTIGDITLQQGYRLLSTTGGIWEITGIPLDPATEYSLQAGQWNWLGYPFLDELSVSQLLAHISEQVEVIMDDDGGVWIPNFGLGPINSLGNILPGEGLYAFVNEDIQFQYQGREELAGGLQKNSEDDYWEFAPFEDAPKPTGKPFPVIVEFSEEILMDNPETIEIWDGNLLVGKAKVLHDKPCTPVIAWEGDLEHNLDGFTIGHRMSLSVLNDNGEVIFSQTGNEESLLGEAQKGYAHIILSSGEFSRTIDLPDEFTVGTCYPQPFNPSVTVPFSLPKAGEVEFAVYDLLGREVFATIQDFTGGKHRFVFDSNYANVEMSSGVYFIQVTFESLAKPQKVLLLQ
ncbi:T9SS type A sorting domain-containing protein, partial [bacterium]|nr:T9SS type A sorting domain-containing protein [bacterium]